MKDYKRLTTKKYGTYLASCGNCGYNNPSFDCDTYNCKQVLIKRLAELEDKIEQKKMLELPFLVGQDAFIIEDNEIVMGVVNGIWWQDEFLIEVRYGKDKYGWRYAQRLKDGIFSTKAEAEKKLEELKNENTCKQQDKN